MTGMTSSGSYSTSRTSFDNPVFLSFFISSSESSSPLMPLLWERRSAKSGATSSIMGLWLAELRPLSPDLYLERIAISFLAMAYATRLGSTISTPSSIISTNGARFFFIANRRSSSLFSSSFLRRRSTASLLIADSSEKKDSRWARWITCSTARYFSAKKSSAISSPIISSMAFCWAYSSEAQSAVSKDLDSFEKIFSL